MAEKPTALLGPRHLVGGQWRVRAEQLAVFVALLPATISILASFWAAFVAGPAAGILGMLGFLSACAIWPVGRWWVRYAWYRTRWWWDCRAGLLLLNAERSLTGVDTGITDKEHAVVAPMLRRLELTSEGRRYTVRPLPSQTAATFDEASQRLAQRWAASMVRVTQAPGQRDVTLIVDMGSPTRRQWVRSGR